MHIAISLKLKGADKDIQTLFDVVVPYAQLSHTLQKTETTPRNELF